jgi:uncharacterized protein (TIGR03435 family)
MLALLAILLYTLLPTKARAQTESGGTTAVLPKFAVATIHPIKSWEPGQPGRSSTSKFTPDGLLDEGVPLKALIRVAFGVSQEQVLRLPDWTQGDYYIAAKVDAADVPQFSKLTGREKWAMVQVLLEDRFGLKFHHETKDTETYMLVIAKGGPKLKKSSPEELAKDAASPPPKVSGSGNGLHVEQNGASMASIVRLISNALHSLVIDKTGLTGRYDFTLDFQPDVAELAPTAGGSERAPNILLHSRTSLVLSSNREKARWMLL